MSLDEIAPPVPPPHVDAAEAAQTNNSEETAAGNGATDEGEARAPTAAEMSEAQAIVPTNPENDWTTLVALYVISIAKKCKLKRKIHDESSHWYARRFNIVTIALILLGALITAIAWFQSPATWVKYIIFLLGLASTTAAAIVKFLKYEQLQTQHLLASQKFLDLREGIQEQFCLNPTKRQNGYTYLALVSKTFRSIVKEAPAPPKNVLEMLKTTNPDPDTEIDFQRARADAAIGLPPMPVSPSTDITAQPPSNQPATPLLGQRPETVQETQSRLEQRLRFELQRNDILGGGAGSWDAV